MLELYLHPLASYCWKVLIALYENATPFTPRVIDLADPAQRAELAALWSFAKFPVLRDRARGAVVPESSIIVEYLAVHHPGPVALVPADPDLAREVRLRDRFFDLYVHEPMQRIVADLRRPAAAREPDSVAAARATLATAYGVVDALVATGPWAAGDAFTLADCAAAPALFYADQVAPIGAEHPRASAYLARLLARPSMARVRREAEPYWHLFPGRR